MAMIAEHGSIYAALHCQWRCLHMNEKNSQVGQKSINKLKTKSVIVLVYINKRCGNRIKAGFFNVKIQDIAVHGTNDLK